MPKSLLASERVLLLLSLVPYLREHGPTSIDELAETFDVKPALLRKLIGFLGTAGIPGETLAYQHNDLFDIDWDAFLEDDIVSLTHTVAIDDTPRFTGTEAAALLAGLHALGGMLPADDVELAHGLAEKLSSALGLESTVAVSLATDARDERIAEFVSAIEQQRSVNFEYRTASGETGQRTVDPFELLQRQGVWYLRGFSHERNAERMFRIDQTERVTLGAPFESRELSAPNRAAIHTIRAIVPERLLPVLKGFAPTVIDTSDSRLPEGLVRIEVEAWHAAAAVRLVQHAPGEIVVESPAVARQAVREWALEALEDGAATTSLGSLG